MEYFIDYLIYAILELPIYVVAFYIAHRIAYHRRIKRMDELAKLNVAYLKLMRQLHKKMTEKEESPLG